jgi:uroporphyrinogen III methyltransferase/synthase
MTKRGHVSLVGAGPGDPALLTRKAASALRHAELVLYDALVEERILAIARRAQRVYVGKRAGRHALTQDEIQALLVAQARRGRRVVRLKGGDPFVFGRGGEEAQALERAGISYDVVPGVSSAIAAPASAGIPVTHRAHASAFLVVSGHDRAVFERTIHALRPNGVTVVILMGFARRAALTRHLLDAGWDGTTPAALVADGTLPTEQTWRGTLADVADGRAALATDGPAIIVVGTVATLQLNGTAVSAATGAAPSGADPSETMNVERADVRTGRRQSTPALARARRG